MYLPLLGAITPRFGADTCLRLLVLARLDLLRSRHICGGIGIEDEHGCRLQQPVRLAWCTLLHGLAALLEQVHRGVPHSSVQACRPAAGICIPHCVQLNQDLSHIAHTACPLFTNPVQH